MSGMEGATSIDTGSVTMVATPTTTEEKRASKEPGWIVIAVCGALVGAAFAASGTQSPMSVTSQLRGLNYHVMNVYLTSAASSAVIIYVARLLKFANCKARSASTLGWFSRYDANIVGGLLQGVGIALTGSLLETIPVQIALGMPSSWSVAMGAFLGGIIYSGYCSGYRRTAATHTRSLTLYGRYGWKEGTAVAMFVALCLGVMTLANWLKPYQHARPIMKLYGRFLIEARSEDSWTKPYGDISFASPFIGGLWIGAVQAACLVLIGGTFGISNSYERLGNIWWWVWRYEKKPNFAPVVFAVSILGGAWTFSKLLDIPLLPDPFYRPEFNRIVGGAYLVIGSRLAGGCASEHGIGGMATLSRSSLITVFWIIITATIWVAILDSQYLRNR